MAYEALVLPPAPKASSESVRRILSRTGRRDTAPELALRRELHRRGLRFLVDAAPAGTSRRRRADVVLRGARIAVLVHGCFWHGCPEHFHAPKANAQWWRLKLESVRRRDADTVVQLEGAGWLPYVVWEHEDMAEVAEQLAQLNATRVDARRRQRTTLDVGPVADRSASPPRSADALGIGAASCQGVPMARVNDVGGMQGFGPVEAELDEPAFSADWEAHVFAMNRALLGAGVYTLDEFRDAIERMPPQDYLASSYYEKWFSAVTTLCVEKGVLSAAEVTGAVQHG